MEEMCIRDRRSVVDGFRLRYLAVRPASDHFRRCEPDFNRIKYVFTHLCLSFPSFFIVAGVIIGVYAVKIKIILRFGKILFDFILIDKRIGCLLYTSRCV